MRKNDVVIVRSLKWVLLGLVIALPLATPLTVWIGSHSNIYIISAWKEAVLLATAPLLAYLLIVNEKLRTTLLTDWSILLSLAIVALYTLIALIRWHGVETLAGLALGVRFLYVYILARVVGDYDRNFWRKAASWLVAITVLISMMAVVQVSLLPKDFLTHLGYDMPGKNSTGIPPAYHLITGSSLVRAQSTLRGPNVLGAFLLLPIILVALWLQTKQAKQNKQLAYGLLGLMGLALFLSYARSAWIGLAAAGLVWLMLQTRLQFNHKTIVVTCGIVLLGIGLVFAMRGSGIERSLLLHADQRTGASISNQGHVAQSKEAMKEIMRQPLGRGVGTAGPASALHSDARIAENYYLQVGQEVGVIGLVLFAWLTVYMGLHFYHQRESRIALAMLASLVGLVLCNLLLHTWSEEAVAIIWWLLAGLSYDSVILDKKRKHNVKAKNQTV